MRLASLSLALCLCACSKTSTPKPAEAPRPADSAPLPPTAGEEHPHLTVAQALVGLAGTGKVMAEITTDHGVITCELFPDQAPKTVASFVGLARGLRAWKDPRTGQWVKDKPFFDDLAFHRVIPGFMIQGGDAISRDYDSPMIGTGDPGFRIPDEVDSGLKFDRPGRLAMANSGVRTSSGGSQFFITEAPKSYLDGGYAIFGQCDGTEVVREIARVPVGGPQNSKPLSAVTMRVKIFRR
jgi:peptidyl-prolyl cis-trans isomerase A (cyclophilin A)